MRIEFDINLNVKGHNESEVVELLKKIINQNTKTMSALSDLKETLALSDQKIDVLTTATAGLTDDIAHLKELVNSNPDGIDAAGVAELKQIIDGQQTKIAEAAQKMADLDAQTTRPTSPPEEPGTGLDLNV